MCLIRGRNVGVLSPLWKLSPCCAWAKTFFWSDIVMLSGLRTQIIAIALMKIATSAGLVKQHIQGDKVILSSLKTQIRINVSLLKISTFAVLAQWTVPFGVTKWFFCSWDTNKNNYYTFLDFVKFQRTVEYTPFLYKHLTLSERKILYPRRESGLSLRVLKVFIS